MLSLLAAVNYDGCGGGCRWRRRDVALRGKKMRWEREEGEMGEEGR
jgi:hypothetical protein